MTEFGAHALKFRGLRIDVSRVYIVLNVGGCAPPEPPQERVVCRETPKVCV